MDNEKLKEVTELVKLGKINEALSLFQTISASDTAEYWLMKGNLEQKFQHWSEAINAYTKVLDIEHENEEAQHQLHLVQNILNFWNPEMFNP